MSGPEAIVEKYLLKQVKKAGGECFKCTGWKDAPDRIVILYGMTVFVELKKEGEVPRETQARMFTKMMQAGAFVFLLDSKDAVDSFIEYMSVEPDMEDSSRIIVPGMH